MKKIGMILLIWVLVILTGSIMTYLFFLLLLLGPFALIFTSDIHYEGIFILLKLSFQYSIPAFAIYSFYSLKKTNTIRELIEESPGRLIAFITLTFLGLAFYYDSFFIFFGFLPFMFSTILVFGFLKSIMKD